VSTQLEALLALDPSGTVFPTTSRYHGLEIATIELPDGRVAAYVRRRFAPPPERFALLEEHVVADRERPDTLAAQYLGDPDRFWQLCDANAAMHPRDLTARPGDVVLVTLPAGVPGVSDG
jgi:hypothetical protein